MFCSQCGAKLQAESKFCNSCGTAVKIRPNPVMQKSVLESAAALESALPKPVSVPEAAPAATIASTGQTPQDEVKKKTRHLLWILPIVCTLAAGAAIGGLYFYQQSVNRKVERLLQEGEKLALDGKWAEGMAKIETALRSRPDHRVLLADRTVLKDAIALQTEITDTDKQVQVKKYSEAIHGIDKLKQQLKTRSGPVFQRLTEAAGKQEEKIVVAQVNNDFPAMEEIAELTPLFHAIKDYQSDEAKKTSKAITQKIVDLSYEKASGELEAKQFDAALSTVEDALKLDENNNKLTTLRTAIEDKKKAFEDAESQRIQQARESATQEENKNRTDAVELVSVDASIDSDGYFVVQGSVKNKATRPISSIVVYFDMLDNYGNVVNHSSVTVTPNALNVGETGTFYNYYYTDGSLTSVHVTYFEWLIN